MLFDNGNFQHFRWLFFETSEMRPALLYSDMQSVVGFSVIPKCMIFFRGLAGSNRANFENKLYKLQKALDLIVEWANEWQLQLSVNKCNILNVGHAPFVTDYYFYDSVLPKKF